MGPAYIHSKWSSGNLIFHNKIGYTDQMIQFGEDGSGLDIKMFGDTAPL